MGLSNMKRQRLHRARHNAALLHCVQVKLRSTLRIGASLEKQLASLVNRVVSANTKLKTYRQRLGSSASDKSPAVPRRKPKSRAKPKIVFGGDVEDTLDAGGAYPTVLRMYPEPNVPHIESKPPKGWMFHAPADEQGPRVDDACPTLPVEGYDGSVCGLALPTEDKPATTTNERKKTVAPKRTQKKKSNVLEVSSGTKLRIGVEEVDHVAVD
jgi:hypothetical protein